MNQPAVIHSDGALALALALVGSSTLPTLLLDDQLVVLAASMSFGLDFDVDPISIRGTPFAEIAKGAWAKPQLIAMLKVTAAGYAEVNGYEVSLARSGQETRTIVVRAQKLMYGDGEPVRLMLSATDVTDARSTEQAKDALIREKAVLLQEIQHRVANSLQIIASILLQSARKVQSEEARGPLRDAHNRVMSIAEVQRQLAVSVSSAVPLRDYLSHLCESLSASMIQDHRRLAIEVRVDESIVGADASVSIGLIVTELVINALKHAFLDRRHGKIVVSYQARGEDWTLSVADDGVGIPTGRAAAKPGLGTGIVDALAKNLGAEISVANTRPGTMVSISRRAAVAGTIVKPLVSV